MHIKSMAQGSRRLDLKRCVRTEAGKKEEALEEEEGLDGRARILSVRTSSSHFDASSARTASAAMGTELL